MRVARAGDAWQVRDTRSIPGDGRRKAVTKGELGTAAIRLLGIYEIVVGIGKLPHLGSALPIVSRMTGMQSYLYVFMQTAQILIPLAVGLLLVSQARRFGQWLFAHPEARLSSEVALRDAQAVAFSIAGIVIAISGLGRFVSAFNASAASRPRAPRGWFHWMNSVHVAGIVLLVLGLFLFFHSTRLSNFWWSLRATRPMAERPSPDPTRDAGTTPRD